MFVLTEAEIATIFADSAEPPLNPNQPGRMNPFVSKYHHLNKLEKKGFTKPHQHSTEDDVGNIIRSIRAIRLIPIPFPKIHRDRKRRGTRRHMHRNTPSKIQHPKFIGPPDLVPRPARDRIIDEGRPDEDKHEHGSGTAAFCDSAYCDGSSEIIWDNVRQAVCLMD